MTNIQEPKIICFEDETFFRLVNEVVQRIRAEKKIEQDRWVNTTEAMRLLSITSRTTLVKLKNEGKIRFTQATSRNTMFDRKSIEAYLDQKARNTF